MESGSQPLTPAVCTALLAAIVTITTKYVPDEPSLIQSKVNHTALPSLSFSLPVLPFHFFTYRMRKTVNVHIIMWFIVCLYEKVMNLQFYLTNLTGLLLPRIIRFTNL